MKRAGRVWIRIFPDVPVSKKPAEVRMGSGKGAPEFWVAKIKPGRILFEIDGVDLATAKEAMRLGAAKAFDRDEVRRARDTAEGAAYGEEETTADDFRGKTADELDDQLVKLKKEQFNLRFQRANGQLEKTNRVREVRKQHRPHRNRADASSAARPAEG